MNKTNITQINNTTKSTKPHQKSSKKIKNWRKYNKALEERGSILLCINKDLACDKFHKPIHKHTIGRPREYSDSLIEMILIIRLTRIWLIE